MHFPKSRSDNNLNHWQVIGGEITPGETIVNAETTAAVAAAIGNSASTVTVAKTASGVSAVVDGASVIAPSTGLVDLPVQTQVNGGGGGGGDDDDEGSKPLDLSWPEGWRKRITYIFLAPILWPLWLTLPDTRTPQGISLWHQRKYWDTTMHTFIWAAFYFLCLTWWCNHGNHTAFPCSFLFIVVI